MAHPKPFPVPAGYPSAREVARRLGLSKTDYATVMRLVEGVLDRRPGDAAKRAKTGSVRRVLAKKKK